MEPHSLSPRKENSAIPSPVARAELWLHSTLTEIATTLQTGHWLQIWEVPFPRANMPMSVTGAL